MTTGAFQVPSTHPLPVGLLGAVSVTVKVVGGGTVYYADQGYVTSASNQGSIANGASQTFFSGVWLVSADSSSITLTFNGAASGGVAEGITGPGGVAGALTGSSITIPSPSSTVSPFDLYYGILNSATVTVTLPDPAANAGVTFVLQLAQDASGGRQFSFSSPPSFEFDGPPLIVVTTASAMNLVRCTSDGLAWHLTPDTSGPPSTDQADQTRYSLHVPILREVKAASVSNQTLSGLPSIDSYQTIATDRVLLTGQTTGSQNGLWVVAAGAWARPSDYPTGGTFVSRVVQVSGGSTRTGLWACPGTTPVTIDTDSTTWSVVTGGGGVASFNTRTGPVTLSKADVTGTGLAAADVSALGTFQGRVTTAATLTKADVTGTGLAAADISAVDASDFRLVTAPMVGAASGRAQTISRVGTTSAGTALGAAGATNTLALGLFTAREALVVASLEFMLTSVFANAGDTVRLGLYTLTQPDTLNMTATLVARTDQTGNSPAFSSQRAAGGSGSTLGTINLPLSVTGGYPSTYTLTVGTRYMIGFLPIFSSGTPKFGTQTTFKVGADMAPYLGGTVAAQSDAPTAINAVGGAAPAFVGSTSVLYWLAASSIV